MELKKWKLLTIAKMLQVHCKKDIWNSYRFSFVSFLTPITRIALLITIDIDKI